MKHAKIVISVFIFALLSVPAYSQGFPVEVFETDPVVSVPAPEGVVDFVYLQVHSPSYPVFLGYEVKKMSMRFNGGPWVDISRETALCDGYEREYECTDGPLATVRFKVPVSLLGSVSELMEFRFNYVEGDVSSGYRILALQADPFITEAPDVPGDSVIVDPPDPEPVEMTGRELWEKRDFLVDFPGGPIIRASCSDCHSSGGEDLKYFGYTPNSITVRSIFHGLTEEQGDKIAAFIDSLDVESVGKPWDPPYQPGPGTDERGAYNWAAGAGLDAVLEEDSLMSLPLSIVQRDSMLNRRELEISLQLPDWNEWLPIFHPVDSWNGDFYTSQVFAEYETLRANLETPGYVEDNLRRLPREIESFFNAVKDAVRSDNTFQPGYNFEELGRRKYSLYQWHAVKSWELFQFYGLQDIAPDVYEEGEELSWISEARTLFNLAPHIHGASKGTNGTCTNTYFDTAWYEVQIIVNAGNETTTGLKPVDDKYHFGHISDLAKDCGETALDGPAHGLRYLAAYLKTLQAGSELDPSAINPRHFWIGRVYKLTSDTGGKNPFREMSEPVRRAYLNKFLDEFLMYLYAHPVDSWDGVLEDASWTPVCDGNDPGTMENYANATRCIITGIEAFGADPELVRLFKDWAGERWPLGNW